MSDDEIDDEVPTTDWTREDDDAVDTSCVACGVPLTVVSGRQGFLEMILSFRLTGEIAASVVRGG